MTNVILTIAFAVLMSLGQIVLSLASKDLFATQKLSISLIFYNYWLWIGLLIYGVSIILWLYILARFDIKYAYPLAATAIFFVAFYQSIIDRTFPPFTYWVGLFFVFLGIIILSLNRK